MFLDLDGKDKTAIAAIDDLGNQIRYGELVDFSESFVNAVNKRALIFILSENSVGALAGYVASLCGKVVPLLLGATIDKEQLDRLLRIYSPEYIWLPEKMSEGLGNNCVFRGFDYSLVKTGLTGYPLHDQLSLLLTTSGSTGSPKLVRHSYTNVEKNAENVAAFFELKNSDKATAVLPLQYTMGLSVATSHLYAGATVLLVKSSLTDQKFWKFIREQRATSFTGVPYSFEVLHKLRFFRMDLPDMELITQGGGKLNSQLFLEYAEFAEKSGRRFIATYGQTEGTARMSYLPAEMATNKICSIGKAIPGGRFSLIDDTGQEVTKAVASGELVYRGPNVTLGYAFKGEDLEKGDENLGILQTGDMARRDEGGYYFIIGRLNRFLKLYGIRVSLDESEQLIRSGMNIDCMCSGTDDKMKVFITEEIKKDSVHKYLAEKTGLFHQAIEVVVTKEIPKNEAGKLIYN